MARSLSLFVLGLTLTVGSTASAAAPIDGRSWGPDQSIPAGYHVERRLHPADIGIGVGIFAAAYVPSLFVATVGSSDPGKVCDPTCRNPYWPLFIPVIGPLMTLVTIPPVAPRTFDWVLEILVVDTLVQTGGLVAAVFGFVPRLTLVANDSTRVSLGVAPMGIGSGLLLQGNF